MLRVETMVSTRQILYNSDIYEIFPIISIYYHYYLFQQREYMSVEEASKIIYTNETWNQYKDILMKRKVDALLRRD